MSFREKFSWFWPNFRIVVNGPEIDKYQCFLDNNNQWIITCQLKNEIKEKNMKGWKQYKPLV
jgi:hypothetical protein